MPNSAAVQQFFLSRMKQAPPATRSGNVKVLLRLNDGVITFPTHRDGLDCMFVTVRRPPPGRLTIALLQPCKKTVRVVEFDPETNFETARKLKQRGRTVAVDYGGDVRMAAPQLF